MNYRQKYLDGDASCPHCGNIDYNVVVPVFTGIYRTEVDDKFNIKISWECQLCERKWTIGGDFIRNNELLVVGEYVSE